MKCVKYHLTNESIRYNAIQYLRTCDLDIIVEFKQRNRSLDQNRKLWACLGDVSRQVEWHGRCRDIKVQAITIEKAVWFFFRLCCFNLLNGEHG